MSIEYRISAVGRVISAKFHVVNLLSSFTCRRFSSTVKVRGSTAIRPNSKTFLHQISRKCRHFVCTIRQCTKACEVQYKKLEIYNLSPGHNPLCKISAAMSNWVVWQIASLT